MSVPPRSALFLLLAYAITVALLLAHHELWRDEWQAWMIGRDSSSLAELWHNRYYDAHPPLWHLLLFLVSRISRDPLCMQALHWFIATFGAGVLLTCSPFSRPLQAALLSGYFMVYEYAVISRNYALGVVWLWLCCWAVTQQPRRYLLLALLFLGMAMTNVHIFLLGGALWVALLLEAFYRPEVRSYARTHPRLVAGCLAILALTAGLFLWITYLPPDTGYPRGFQLNLEAARFCRALSGILVAYVPIPLAGISFHDTSLFNNADLRWTAFYSALLWLAGGFCLRTPLARSYYVLGSALLLFFCYAKFMGFNRHIGHFYLLWVACLWINGPLSRPAQGFVWLIAVLQMGVAIHVAAIDWRNPFTPAGDVANFLRNRGLQDLPIVGMPDGVASAVAGNLDRSFYYPDCKRWGTFLIWDNRRDLQPFPAPDLLQQIGAIARHKKSRVVLVSDRQLFLRNRTDVVLELLATFPAGVITSEHYYVYLIQLTTPQGQP